MFRYPNFPSHWHFNKANAVIPDAIIDAVPSYVFSKGVEHIVPETHGYDAKFQRDLDAIFIAVGPSFRKNIQVDAFENVHVLPILTRALELRDVTDIDGNYQIAEQIVK